MPIPTSRAQSVPIDAVIPPGAAARPFADSRKEHASQAARIVAHWMDEFIRIPGTNIRMGLDPLLGLIPGLGGIISSSVSMVVLIEAVRLRVPVAVLLRMFGNVLVNEVLDAIPMLGDAASVFFRSHSKNVDLLNRWKSGEKATLKRGSRWVLGMVLAFGLGLLAIWILVLFTFFGSLWHLAGRMLG